MGESSDIEKKLNKAYYIGAFIGGSIGFLIYGGAGAFIGVFLGIFLGFLLFNIFAEEQFKKYREAELEKSKTAKSKTYMPDIKCPTCHANSVHKITAGKKLAYVAGLGILAPAFKKVRSQFECRRCGYKW